MTQRLFVKIKRELLPRVEDRYPYVYLEHGRLEVDDSSVKWIDSEGFCVAIPVAMICCLFLGPGSTVTHEAIKVTSAANCSIAWVGELGDFLVTSIVVRAIQIVMQIAYRGFFQL